MRALAQIGTRLDAEQEMDFPYAGLKSSALIRVEHGVNRVLDSLLLGPLLPARELCGYNAGTMVDKLPLISGVHFEQTPERLKIVLPVARKWGYLAVYSALVVAWLGMMIGGVIFIVRILGSGAGYRFVFAVMIVILLAILFRFGRFLWRQWAAFASNREVLLVNPEELIVRHPVSIWGNTDVYDMAHVSPFYQSANPPALAFDYGYRHIYVGEALTGEARHTLAQFLNQQYLADRL